MHFNGPIIRPQTDAYSLFVEVTVGCTHNSCKFCNFYNNYPFKMAPLSQIEEDLIEAQSTYPHAKEIWANGGNPYALSAEKLAPVGDLFQKYFPNARVSTYARVDDVCRKSVEDIRLLKEKGFVDLLIGIENGDDVSLKYMNKGYTSKDIIEAGKKLDEAGVDYRFSLVTAMAGPERYEESAILTADVINEINPYMIYLNTLSIVPGTPLYDERAEGKFVELGERQRVRELIILLEHLKKPLYVQAERNTTRYSFIVKFPEDRDKLLDIMKKDLESITDKEEAYRKMMRESRMGV